jgi:hypothetical protein
MKAIQALAVAAGMLAAAPAFSATTIDFEGVTSFASIGDYYNGGTDGAGASGPNLGVSFSAAALALSNDELGPYFSHAPSPGSVMFATDASALMNVGSGFADEVSFYYSASSSAFDVVTIYAGLDGSGAVLGSFSLSQNAQLGGCSDTAFCNWQRISLSFGGVAHSMTLGGNAGNVAFDNVTISAVPEAPVSAMLALGGIGMLFWARRQRQA